MRPPRIIAIAGLALVCSACPEEDEKSLPVLSATGAGSIPGPGAPDDGGPVDATASATDTGATGTDTDLATGTAGGGTVGGDGTSDGSGTFGDSDSAGATDSIGPPPGVTTGEFTTG